MDVNAGPKNTLVYLSLDCYLHAFPQDAVADYSASFHLTARAQNGIRSDAGSRGKHNAWAKDYRGSDCSHDIASSPSGSGQG
jgi:hypothetical protein